MSKNCIITVDAGTSSLRSIASWQDGTAFLRSSRRYQPQYARPATVEQEPLTWTDALLLTLREVAEGLTAQGLRPAAISLTSQRASVIPTNDKGEALHAAIMWQDKRSIPQCETLQRTIGLQTIYARTGLRIDPYFSLPKMLWLKKTLPDVYGHASKLLGVQDYIAHFMTARFITDWTQASRTMLMDIHKHIWDPVLLEETGIEPSKLPELCPPGYCIGGSQRSFLVLQVSLRGRRLFWLVETSNAQHWG